MTSLMVAGRRNRGWRACIGAIEQSHAQRFVSNRKLHELLETAFDENWPIVQEHARVIHHALAAIASQGKRDQEFAVSDCEAAAFLVGAPALLSFSAAADCRMRGRPEPTVNQMVDFCTRALSGVA